MVTWGCLNLSETWKAPPNLNIRVCLTLVSKFIDDVGNWVPSTYHIRKTEKQTLHHKIDCVIHHIMKILLARSLSMAKKWNPTQTDLNEQQKLLVRITSKSRMAWATSTEMESLRPSLYSAFFSIGCNFRNVLPCKATSQPAAPDSQVHHLGYTWLSLSEQQGELWQSCTCDSVWG